MVIQSFAEAYNARRHEQARASLGQGNRGRRSFLQWDAQASIAASLGSFAARVVPTWAGPLREDRLRPGAAAPSGYMYTLVRSDLDEEVRRQELPAMHPCDMGLKQRTKTLISEIMQMREEEALTGPFSFVETDRFQGISGLVICINAVLIGLETDIETPAWVVLEELLLCFFVFELTCRLLHHGGNYFRHEDEWTWNCFDFFIVMTGVVDQWLVPFLVHCKLLSLGVPVAVAPVTAAQTPSAADGGGGHAAGHGGAGAQGAASGEHQPSGGGMSVFFMLMRMLRLLRIVRLFRLVRIVRPLYDLAQGVLEALQGMFWVLVLLLMTLYICAILCTRLIGEGYIISQAVGESEQVNLEEVLAMFTTVEDAMFALFGTMSSWSLLKFAPLFEEMPLLKPTLVVFYVYSAWALLAVMTGVVSENMIVIREQMLKEDEAREEKRKAAVTNMLIELFQESDTDHSGKLSRQEFDNMLESESLVRKIERNTRLKKQDLNDLFDWIDHDKSGYVTIDEFMAGFRWVNEPLRAKLLVKLQDRLTTQLASLQNAVTDCVERRIAEVQQLVAGPLQKVHAITEQMQTLDSYFTGLKKGLREQGGQHKLSHQELTEVEQRLMDKARLVLARLEAVENRVATKERLRKAAMARVAAARAAAGSPPLEPALLGSEGFA